MKTLNLIDRQNELIKLSRKCGTHGTGRGFIGFYVDNFTTQYSFFVVVARSTMLTALFLLDN